MVATLKKALAEKGLLDAPRPRLVVPEDFPPAFPDASERVRWCDRINFLVEIYQLRPWLRTRMGGYYGLESMPDDELEALWRLVEYAAQCCRDQISFEDAGLIDYNQE